MLTERAHPAQAALSSQLPSAAAGTSAVVMAALRDAYPAEVMNLASNLDMNVRPAIQLCTSPQPADGLCIPSDRSSPMPGQSLPHAPAWGHCPMQ